MTDETVAVTDHNADLVAIVKEQTEHGKAALAALKTHSNAGAAGSTVHTAIESFGNIFEKIGHALDLHKEHLKAAGAVTGETVSEPAAPGELTDAGKQWESDQAAASVAAHAATLAKQEEPQVEEAAEEPAAKE